MKRGLFTISRKTTVWLLIVVALLCAVGFRVAGIQHKYFMDHDEPITYLQSTGQALDYVALNEKMSPPVAEWAPAAEWQRFIEVQEPFVFGDISLGLARADIHPPLYFWLLHVWMVLFGSGIWVGPAFNTFIAVLMIGALFMLGRRVLGDDVLAASVCLVWALIPPAIESSLIARQYDLMALFGLLLFWEVLRYSDPDRHPGWTDHVLLALISAAGVLTHYHFAIPAVGAAILGTWRSWRGDRRRIRTMFASFVGGAVVFLALNPGLLEVVKRQQEQASPMSAGAFRLRVEATVDLLRGAVGLNTGGVYVLRRVLGVLGIPVAWVLALVGVGSGALAAFTRRGRSIVRRVAASVTEPDSRPVLFLLAWVAGVIIALYLGFVSPGHAMKPRYLALAWALFAFVPVFAVRRFRPALRVLLVFCLWLAVADTFTFVRTRSGDPAVPVFSSAGHIVTDDLARAQLLRYVAVMPADTPVFADWRGSLVETPEAWIDELEVGDIVILSDAYQPTDTPKEAVLELLDARWDVVRVGKHSVPDAVYELALQGSITD